MKTRFPQQLKGLALLLCCLLLALGWAAPANASSSNASLSSASSLLPELDLSLTRYEVTLPESTAAYTVRPALGALNPAIAGGWYSFCVEKNPGYEDTTLLVQANGTVLNDVLGYYTITNIRQAQAVTVTMLSGQYYTMHWLDGFSYTLTPEAGYSSQVEKGDRFCFSVDATSDSVQVYANAKRLQPDRRGVYTISNVNSDQWLVVVPVSELSLGCPIFIATMGSGSAKPSGLHFVDKGEDFSVSFTPKAGAELTSLMIDGESMEPAASYTFRQVDGYHIIIAMFSAAGGALDGVLEPFTDVADTDWFYDPVRYVYSRNLMNGVTPTTFAPYDSMTRAMLATVIYRHAGSPQVAASSAFSDVAIGAWYGDAVNWGAQQRILSGVGDSRFAPDQPVTREQLAAILYRYVGVSGQGLVNGVSLSAYPDAARISPYAQDAMSWAVAAGILQGDGQGRLNPQANASRAEVAAMLMRLDNHLAAK